LVRMLRTWVLTVCSPMASSRAICRLLRRALGATRAHIRVQFLAEAVLLAFIGGAVGVGAGALSTAVYASIKHELVVIPAEAWAGGLAAALLIGALAGLLPAIRAARLSPTRALWSI